MRIWVIGALNQLFIRGFYPIQLAKKLRSAKYAFFVIDPSCTPYSICLNNWLLIGQFCKEMLRFQQ